MVHHHFGAALYMYIWDKDSKYITQKSLKTLLQPNVRQLCCVLAVIIFFFCLTASAVVPSIVFTELSMHEIILKLS